MRGWYELQLKVYDIYAVLHYMVQCVDWPSARIHVLMEYRVVEGTCHIRMIILIYLKSSKITIAYAVPNVHESPVKQIF